MSAKKKLSEMTLEEQAAYYQRKAAAVKAKMVKEANKRCWLIGKIASEVFDDLPVSENALQAYFTNLYEAYTILSAYSVSSIVEIGTPAFGNVVHSFHGWSL